MKPQDLFMGWMGVGLILLAVLMLNAGGCAR
jgi:hypothetical protein